MGLNLNEFIREDGFVEYDGVKYIVTSKISRELYDAFYALSSELAEMRSDTIAAAEYKAMETKSREFVIKHLSLKNEKALSEKFINSLPSNLYSEVYKYISDFLSNISDEKKNKIEKPADNIEGV